MEQKTVKKPRTSKRIVSEIWDELDALRAGDTNYRRASTYFQGAEKIARHIALQIAGADREGSALFPETKEFFGVEILAQIPEQLHLK